MKLTISAEILRNIFRTTTTRHIALLILLLLVPALSSAQVIAKNNPSNPVWSDPDSWIGSTIPGSGDEVEIPTGVTIYIDQDAEVESILIHGELIATNDQDLYLTANYILVQGDGAKFIWGTEADPYTAKGVITLRGNDPALDIHTIGSKFIGAIEEGSIIMHGEERLAWTQLSATADAGSTDIQVVDATDWRIGDEIIIASTDYSALQAEIRTITEVTGAGRTIHLDVPLDTLHYGEMQYFHGGTLELDERAEVGLLTHNILIRGEEADESGFGGHIIVKDMGSSAYISGVELYHMGQKGLLGRYPFHWHHAHDVTGQYFKNSSVHHSFNRVMTVHHTSNALIQDIVAYDHIGHGFFMEAGSERGNIFDHNLGVLTRKPEWDERVQRHDRLEDDDHSRHFPATFWITNPDNTFINNAAAGSEGSGFWMLALEYVIGDPTNTLVPGDLPIREFRNNRGHSNNFTNLAIDAVVFWDDENENGQVDVGEEFTDYKEYRPPLPPGTILQVEEFTSFKAGSRGIWTRAGTMYFENCRLANSHSNAFFSFNQILRNSLIVGQSANVGVPRKNQHDMSVSYSLPVLELDHTERRNRLHGHILYDGPSGLDNVHFAGFDHENTVGFGIFGAHRKSPAHWSRGITWAAGTPDASKVDFDFYTHVDNNFASGLIDFDGTVTGVPNSRLVPLLQWSQDYDDDPMAIRDRAYNAQFESTDMLVTDWDAVVTHDLDVGTMYMRPDWGTAERTGVYGIRYLGMPQEFERDNYPTMVLDAGREDHIMQPVVFTNNDMAQRTEMYIWQFHRTPHRMPFYLQWARQDHRVISAFTHMPSEVNLVYEDGTSVPYATDIWDLVTNPDERYFIHDNILYVHHKATEFFDDVDLNGLDNQYKSPTMILCMPSHCASGSGATEEVIIADFEADVYDRSTLRGEGMDTPELYVSARDPGFCSSTPCDNLIGFNLVTDGDGTDDYVRYTTELYEQPWTHYKFLNLKLDARAVNVILQLAVTEIDLGTYIPVGGVVSIPIYELPKEDRDMIIGFELRFYESSLSFAPAVDEYEVNINEISLSIFDLYGATTPEVLGVQSLSHSSNRLHLFPNPSVDWFTLTADLEKGGLVEINIYTLDGRTLYSKKENATAGKWSHVLVNKELALEQGIYQVVVRNENQQFSGLVVIR
ncbi:G8 domain-containing protein [Ekhidna sp.]|uniref:G8 domain-containing protein n=1 Tax=Ekhidna sp. TaxID=2608089 RepID=UPI003C79ECF9